MKTITFDETKWKLVPVDATEEMLAAAHESDRQYTLRVFGDIPTVQQGAHDHWVAMLAAAPTQPECEHNNAPAVNNWHSIKLVPPVPSKVIRSGLNALGHLFDIAPISDGQRARWLTWSKDVRAMLTREEDAAPAPAVPQGLPKGWRSSLEFVREMVDQERSCRSPSGQDRAQYTRAISVIDSLLAATPAPAPAQPIGRTELEIVEQTEELAAFLMDWRWGQAPESPSVKFRSTENVKAQKCWAAACHIQEMITATDVENAVAEVDDDPEPDAAPAQEVPSDPNGWCQYVAGMIFCWLQMQKELPNEDQCVAAIAGIIERRVWAYKPAQRVGLTEQRTYRLLQAGIDKIEAADEFLSDDTNTWAVDPNGIFVGVTYMGNVLRPARRAIISALRAKGAA